MKIVSNKICRETRNIHFMFKLFLENRAIYEITWKKYCIAGQAADDSMTHSHFMLDN
jgi:hypothetical protein